MHPSAKKGNNPEGWQKLLTLLDDRLQLGMMNHLERVASYHLEDNLLTIQPGDQLDFEYLSKDSVKLQLGIFAEEVFLVRELKILPASS